MNIQNVIVACGAMALCVAACAEGEEDPLPPPVPGERIEGATGQLGGASVTTFAVSDGMGGVTQVGATLPLSVFAAATPENVSIDFPEVVKRTTFLDHVYFNKVPHGHPPAAYLVEHLDLHFMGIPAAERDAIDCTNELMPAGDLVPPSYVIPGVGDEAHGGTCVPKMGVHAIDVTSPELAPQNPTPFARTLVLGYHAGMLIFYEPMVTRTSLEQRQSFTFALPKLSRIDRATTTVPTRLDALYDSATDSYTLVLSDFVLISNIVTLE